MSTSQHEEWRFIPETASNRAGVTTADARQVAEILGDSRVQRAQRGRLIAAAPDMLEACKLALHRLNDLLDDGTGEHSPAYNQIQAAIAKAEGQS